MSDSLLKKLLFAALSTNLLLLLLNLFIGPADAENTDDLKFTLHHGNADSVLYLSLREYNIADSLISVVNKRAFYDDTLSRFFNIRIPGDIRLPEYLASLQANAKSEGFSLMTTQENAATIHAVLSDGKTKYLLAKLHHSPGIKRNACSVAFFVQLIPGSTIKADELNNLPAGFFPLIKCDKTTLPIHQNLVSENGGYGVYLDNTFADVEFRLDFAFSNQRFNSALDNIFTYFRGMRFLLISNEANYYLPSALQRITSAAGTKQVAVFGTGFMVDLRNNSLEIVRDEIEILISKLGADDAAYFLIDDYTYIRNEKMLLNLRKKGVKMLSFQNLSRRAALNPAANN